MIMMMIVIMMMIMEIVLSGKLHYPTDVCGPLFEVGQKLLGEGEDA